MYVIEEAFLVCITSGTPFQFQLPQNGLLRPHRHISPPSQRTLTPSPPPLTQHTVTHHTTATLVTQKQHTESGLRETANSLPQLQVHPLSSTFNSSVSHTHTTASRDSHTSPTTVSHDSHMTLEAVGCTSLGDRNNVNSSSAVNQNLNNTEHLNKQSSATPCSGDSSLGLKGVSPRKSLSLRKRRRSNSVPIETQDALTDKQNGPHTPNRTLNQDSAKEKSTSDKQITTALQNNGVGLRVESQQQEQQRQPQGFVLGCMVNESREEVDDDSQREMTITVAGDSQFEVSAESQSLLHSAEGPSTLDAQPPLVERVIRPLAAPPGSIFSNVGASKRITRTVGSERNWNRRDPFEFDSESHNTPAEFTPHRKKKACNGGDEAGEGVRDEGLRGEGVGSEDVVGVYVGRTLQEGTGVAENDTVSGVTSVTSEAVTGGVGEMSDEVESGEGERVEGMEAGLVVHVDQNRLSMFPGNPPTPSTHPHSSTPSHPPTNPSPPTIVGPFPSTPYSLHNLTPHTVTVGTLPLYTPPHLPFTSPTSRVSHQELRNASSAYLARGGRYAVRHVHRFLHVVKVVSQEVYEGERIVDGLNTVWQVNPLPPSLRFCIHYCCHSDQLI